LSAGGALFFLAMSVILAYETWALWTGNRTVTSRVGEFTAAHPNWVGIASLVIGLLLGHFLWKPGVVRDVRRELTREEGCDGEGGA
jgi:hypothetical protein